MSLRVIRFKENEPAEFRECTDAEVRSEIRRQVQNEKPLLIE